MLVIFASTVEGRILENSEIHTGIRFKTTITGDESDIVSHINFHDAGNSNLYFVYIYPKEGADTRPFSYYIDGNRQANIPFVNGTHWMLFEPFWLLNRARVGDSSIVFEAKNESLITFDFTEEGYGIQEVYLFCNGTNIGNLNVSYDSETYKFSGKGDWGSDLKYCHYQINSTYQAINKQEDKWSIGGALYDFKDICSRTFPGQNADCSYTTSRSTQNKSPDDIKHTLNYYFWSDENIDPTITDATNSYTFSTDDPYPFAGHRFMNFTQNGTINRVNVTWNVSTNHSAQLNLTVRSWNGSTRAFNDYFTGDLDEDLILYMRFDEDPDHENSTNTKNWAVAAENHTSKSAGSGTYVSSPIGQAMDSNYNNYYSSIVSDGDLNDASDSYTWVLWLKRKDGGSTTLHDQYFMSNRNGNDNGWAIRVQNPYWSTCAHTSATGQICTGANVGTWNHLVFTYNGTTNDAELYKNGELIGTTNRNVADGIFLSLGYYDWHTDYKMNASIDEVMVYKNRILTEKEIQTIYTRGHLKFFEESSYIITSDGVGSQVFNISNNTEIVYAEFSLETSGEATTNPPFTLNAYAEASGPPLPSDDGDTQKPNVTIISPLNGSVYNYTYIIDFKVSAQDNVSVDFLGGNLTWPNSSVVLYQMNASINLSLIGNYTFCGYANDTSGNENNSECIVVEAIDDLTEPFEAGDTQTPNVTVVSPLNGSVYNYTMIVSFKVSAQDNVSIDFLGGNLTFPDSTTTLYAMNTSINLTQIGNYTFCGYANDTSGNENNSECIVVEAIDNLPKETTPPSVISLVPTAGSNKIVNQSLSIGATVTDNSGVSNVWYNLTYPNSSISFFQLSHSGGGVYTGTFTPTTTGLHTVYIYSNDTLNNINNSETTNFNVTVAPPPSPPPPLDLCVNPIMPNRSCTLISPPLDTTNCSLPLNYSMYDKNGTKVGEGNVSTYHNNIYSINFTRGTGQYVVEWCDEQIVLTDVKNTEYSILAAVLLIPLILALVLVFSSFALGDEHVVLKIFLFLGSFASIIMSYNLALKSFVEVYNFPDVVTSLGNSTYWTGLIFAVITFYFLLYLFWKMIKYAGETRKQKLEY